MRTEKHIADLEAKLEFDSYKLNSLLEITRAISTNQDVPQIVRHFEFIMHEQLRFNRFVLFIRDKEWKCLLKVGTKSRMQDINVETEFERFKELTIIESSNSSLLDGFDCVIPVRHKGKPLAYLLISGKDLANFNSEIAEQLRFVQTITNVVVMAIENRRMANEDLKRARLKKELEVASEMQKLLFPSNLPSNKQMDVSARFLPRHEVSGDYYDFIEISDDEYMICIADVSGKGISAAMLMANFQATLRTILQYKRFDMEFLVQELNKKVMKSANGEKFITFFIAQYNARTRELQYVNAGHNQPFLTNGRQFKLLDQGTVGLGMFDDLPFIHVGREVLPGNTMLVLYTDGVVELENLRGNFFGLEQLVKLVKNFYRLSMEDLNSLVFSKLDEWRGNLELVDDTAIFSCRFF